MKKLSRWSVLWRAIKKWWKNEPPPPIEYNLVDENWLKGARTSLVEYGRLYSERTMITNPQHSAQAAAVIAREGHKRAPTIESEIRVISLAVERILGHLELGAERERGLLANAILKQKQEMENQ